MNTKLNSLMAIIMAIIILTIPVGQAVYASNSSTFSDVPSNDWAKPYIENLYGKGIIDGYGNGKFGPNDPIRRQHVAKMVVGAVGLEPIVGSQPSFDDVPLGNEFAAPIALAQYKGIFQGVGDGKFGWNDYITRRQIANTIVRAFDLKKGSIDVDFEDTNFAKDPEAKENIQILASNGIVKGYTEGNRSLFKPRNSTTRAQFTKILTVAMAVSGVQEAEKNPTAEAIAKAENLVSSLPADTAGENTKSTLQARLNDLQGPKFLDVVNTLPSIEEIKLMDGPGLNKVNDMIKAGNERYEALSSQMKSDKDVINAKAELTNKNNEVIKIEKSAASAFVTKTNSLPSVTDIGSMDLTQLDEANTKIGAARAQYALLPSQAKKDTSVVSSEKDLSARENALYSAYRKLIPEGAKDRVEISSTYDQTLTDQVNKQMKANPQTDYRGGGWKKATETEVRFFLDPTNFTAGVLGWGRVKITSGSLRLYSGPGEDNDIIGELKNEELYPVLEDSNGWYKLKTKDTEGWVPKTNITYTALSNNSIFQFLDLSKPANLSPIYLNEFAKTKGILAGQGANYRKASTSHSINEIYLLSHSFLETGHGKSQLASGVLVDKNGRIFDNYGRYINSKGQYVDAKGNPLSDGQAPVMAQGPYTIVYNMFGIGARDADPLMLGAQRAFQEGWTSVDKAITGGAKYVASDYVYNANSQNTLYKMRWNPGNLTSTAYKQYATDIGWAYKQVNSMYNYYSQASGYTLYFDIPVYKPEAKVASFFILEDNLEEEIVEEEEIIEEIIEEEIIEEEVIEEMDNELQLVPERGMRRND